MPSPGDNLSINALAAATGATPKSLGTIAGSTATPIAVSEFTVTGITTPTASVATVAYGSTITVTSNFTGTGARFLSRIGSRAANFTWSTPANLTLTTNNGYNRIYTNAYNPGSTSCSSSTTRTVAVTFADGFNLTASNYNVALTTTAFTTYSPPKPSLTGIGLVRPPQPCDTVTGGCGAACYGASIRLNGNAGSYNGVLGSSNSYYIAGVLRSTVAGNTSTYDSAAIFCGNTAYSCYVINNYSCQGDAVNVTTLAYL
jgi:hypothetical protein